MKVFKQVSEREREREGGGGKERGRERGRDREGEGERERERDVLFRQIILSANAGLHKSRESRVKKCIYLSPVSSKYKRG